MLIEKEIRSLTAEVEITSDDVISFFNDKNLTTQDRCATLEKVVNEFNTKELIETADNSLTNLKDKNPRVFEDYIESLKDHRETKYSTIPDINSIKVGTKFFYKTVGLFDIRLSWDLYKVNKIDNDFLYCVSDAVLDINYKIKKATFMKELKDNRIYIVD